MGVSCFCQLPPQKKKKNTSFPWRLCGSLWNTYKFSTSGAKFGLAMLQTFVDLIKDLGSVKTSGRPATWVGWQEAIEAIRQKLKRFKAIPSWSDEKSCFTWTWITVVPPKAYFFSPQLGWFVDIYRVYWGIPHTWNKKKRVTAPWFHQWLESMNVSRTPRFVSERGERGE